MMIQRERVAVIDDDGNERPAMVVARHEGIGVVVDWLRTGCEQIVHPERLRPVTDDEWDLACEFDAFAAPCFKCGQVKPDPRPYAACSSCQEAERQPQGEAVRLFQPAPNEIRGQLAL